MLISKVDTKKFCTLGGCYFGSATEKAEDGAKFIVMVLLLGNCTYVHSTGQSNLLQHYVLVSCMQISNITLYKLVT